MVDCTGLENRQPARVPGFESLALRHFTYEGILLFLSTPLRTRLKICAWMRWSGSGLHPSANIAAHAGPALQAANPAQRSCHLACAFVGLFPRPLARSCAVFAVWAGVTPFRAPSIRRLKTVLELMPPHPPQRGGASLLSEMARYEVCRCWRTAMAQQRRLFRAPRRTGA